MIHSHRYGSFLISGTLNSFYENTNHEIIVDFYCFSLYHHGNALKLRHHIAYSQILKHVIQQIKLKNLSPTN
jgi:endo-1,4-beta-mannosidase